jgi:CRISPR-associated protein Cas5h
MKVLAFDVTGKLAHFRRPDTTATHMTYPFITPTAAQGLIGAILGITDFVSSGRIGLQLLNPVMAVSQQMSMLGKDGGTVFNRPTTMELLINPAYRIYYADEQYGDQLLALLQSERSVYPTYLGVAYALTKPKLYRVYEGAELTTPPERVVTQTVVPIELIEEVEFEPDRYYCRAGGFMRTYNGNRTYEKSIDFLYERDGKPITIKTRADGEILYMPTEEHGVCLF